MVSIAIVDDDKEDILTLERHIARYFAEKGGEYGIASFYDGSELMRDYAPKYDIVFLDIDMEKLNGMAAAKRIRDTDEHTAIVFVTRMAKYAIKGYEVSALDFIVKPVEYGSFALKFKRALEYVAKNSKQLIEIKQTSGTVYIDMSEIKYVEILKHYLIYHTERGDFKVLGALKWWRNSFPPIRFACATAAFWSTCAMCAASAKARRRWGMTSSWSAVISGKNL